MLRLLALAPPDIPERTVPGGHLLAAGVSRPRRLFVADVGQDLAQFADQRIVGRQEVLQAPDRVAQ